MQISKGNYYYLINREKYDITKIMMLIDYNRLSKLATHKIIMYFIFINCTVIEIYSMKVMIMFADLSALPTLMVAVITESISYAIYCAKSYQGTKQEKIQELDDKKFELNKEIAKYEMDNNIHNN